MGKINGNPLDNRLPQEGEIESAHGLVLDITERKIKEEEIRAVREKAEEATLLKDKFVALVAHNLRSPLATMLGFFKMLLDEALDRDKKTELVKRLSCKTETMLQLIDDLLTASRLNTEQIHVRPVFMDACFLVSKAVEDCALLAEAKGVATVNEIPPGSRIHADPELLREVLADLVSNAIKFSHRGDRIRIFLPEGRSSTIAVADEGVGIKPGRLKRLFHHQDTTPGKGTEGETGIGMGLALAHGILTAHGGGLEVESSEGKGSIFYATLPHVRPRVLVVDDQIARRQVMQKYLRSIEIDAIETVNSFLAEGIIEKTSPHLILSDYESHEVDGPGLLSRIKEKPRIAPIPFLALIPTVSMELRDHAFRMGAADCIPNPLSPEDFLPRVRRFVG